MRSLSATLLAWLLPPLLVVGAVAAAGASVFMQRRLTAAYDQDLGDIARAIVPYLREVDGRIWLAFDEQADAVLRADSHDHIYYAVKDADDRLVAGDRALPSPPAPASDDAAPLFWDDRRFGQPVRAVALRAPIANKVVTVIAAETTNKRESAASDALLSAIAPVAMLTLAAMVAVVVGVRRGLAPVDRLRKELQARSHVDLRAVDEAHVADELRPLVHELNEMLARLESAQNSQTRFIANAAHQLRTPIAGLITQIDLASGSRDASAHLEQARTAAARLARLAQQILSLAAADPVSHPAPIEADVDLAEVVKDRADTWLRAARGVELEFDLASARVRGNELLLGELASNLVDNACRYGARTVRVGTRVEGARSVLEIEDDGPGIPEGERARIFERFHRLADPSTEGSGLGLAIVAEIAQRHEATVDVADARNNPTGTRVTVSFPTAWR